MRGRPIRLIAVLTLVVVAVVATRLWTARDGGTRAPVVISVAGADNDLPARVVVLRAGSRRVEIRPEWASWSGSPSRSGLRLHVDVGARSDGPDDFDLAAWWAPGQPSWAVDPRIQGGQDVTVGRLGGGSSEARPRGWAVTWSGGPTIERDAALLVVAAQTRAATPWRGSFGSSGSAKTVLGVCDGEDSTCGAVPDSPPR
jgi:hypothetical protein